MFLAQPAYRLVIVDDNPQARDVLAHYLFEYHPDTYDAGRFDNVEAAWDLIKSGQVDGVFLDISWAGAEDHTGFMLASRIAVLEPKPWIVFVSGHPYAENYREAFNNYDAVYFVEKPVNPEKIRSALGKIRRLWGLASAAPGVTNPTDALGDGQSDQDKTANSDDDPKVEIQSHRKDGEKITRWVKASEIVFIRLHDMGDRKYSLDIYLTNGSPIYNVQNDKKTIDWENKKLPCMCRIRKHELVNLRHVSAMLEKNIQSLQAAGSKKAFFLQFTNEIYPELRIGESYIERVREGLKGCS